MVFVLEIWSVAGKGVLSRALQQAAPKIPVRAVQIGRDLKDWEIGRATLYKAPERFEQDAEYPPPFPSCPNYDQKAWRFVKRFGQEGCLLWNVA